MQSQLTMLSTRPALRCFVCAIPLRWRKQINSVPAGYNGVMQKIYMNEYEQIKNELAPILASSGLELIKEEMEQDAFGSAYSVYSGRGLTYRILWDGKDGCGYIQSLMKNNWINLKATAPEISHNAFGSALFRMRLALIEHKALAQLNA